jgi:hypothetical protein
MLAAATDRSLRFLVAIGATFLVALLAALELPQDGDQAAAAAEGPRSPCRQGQSIGATEHAAGVVVETFLRTVVLEWEPQHVSSCAGALAVAGLVPARYATRFPQRAQGWYQLAPRVRNANGRWEYAGFLWVDAADAAPVAFELLLELRGNRWLVSRFRRAPGSAEIDVSKLPT